MILNDLFKRECKHERFQIEDDIGYCPDCGELIETKWYIARCACCGVKHKAIYKNGKVLADEKFCSNCGSKEFVISQINKINFIDINYAVPVKTVVKQDVKEFTQSWVSPKETSSGRPQLLQQFR